MKTSKQSNKAINTSMRMTKELKDKCDDLAFKNDLSLSTFIRLMVENGIPLLESGVLTLPETIALKSHPKTDKARPIYLGKNILTLRMAYGLTQRDLAKYLLVSGAAVARWELGEFIPTEKRLVLLCEFFNISRETLLYSSLKDLDKEDPSC